MTNEILDFRPGMEMTWEIRETDPFFETKFWMESDTSSPPLHLHPHAEERYEVVEGSMEVNLDGGWHKVRQGESFEVPPGAPHTLRPDSETEEGAVLINAHDPAMNYETFFREFHNLASEGLAKFPPLSPGSLLRVGQWLSAYPDEIRGVRPPQWLFEALAWMARRVDFERRTPD